MIDQPALESGDMPSDVREKAKRFIRSLEAEIRAEAKRASIPSGFLPILLPCNLLCALTNSHFHFVFTHENAGGLPRHIWIDRRERVFSGHPPEHESLLRYAAYELGFVRPRAFCEPLTVLDLSGKDLEEAVSREAKECVRLTVEELAKPRCIAGYEALQPILDAFSGNHPKFEQNVFIAMRFRGEQFPEIDRALRGSLSKYGLSGHRADDRMYSPDNDLWNNVCVYMMGCKYAICVFEDIHERQFNPNVAIAYGFLRSIGRQILILKERRLPIMPTDMLGKMYREFDSYKIGETIAAEVGLWAERDLNLKSLASI